MIANPGAQFINIVGTYINVGAFCKCSWLAHAMVVANVFAGCGVQNHVSWVIFPAGVNNVTIWIRCNPLYVWAIVKIKKY